MKLVIGNKNYSSWSMRPWLALRGCDIAFEEIVIPLYTADPADKARILEHSPAGKVPILIDGAVTVWDSLAIIEYLAERFPAAGLWPADAAARALARSVSAEMHSGFQALRSECPMNLHRAVRPVQLSADAKANIARIEDIWRDCRARHGAGGPFLFGRFSGADAMFAPVVTRFHSFAVPVTADTRAYMETMMAMPAFAAWVKDGLAETWIIERVEAV
ncbi:glutathione S-transferase family protein [Bradyrhizobium sp. STM 3809]|uniref:glutathione S-transferase family protein n=1 Tax=Bradyrhizobium sp. STM 3809 TaxID=551936 RepID=UPI0002408C37|nr:glutathione S-transferase family protein [Bradyrhizobium sp. STM 3809]CCD98445.1 putative glutathione S-transferase (GST) [Bradyrhizobium sp. STM 3809]